MKARFLVLPALLSAGFAAPAYAQAANYSELTGAVDWSSAITAIMAVGALLAGVLVVRKGIRFVLGVIR